MRLLFLGTGTSTGVPQIGCHCEVCRSLDPVDHRLRASALVEIGGKNILIDCGPDFRQQMLRARSPHLDCALLTHSHYDHVAGIDDLRPYCKEGAFRLYCKDDVAKDLRERVPYCFYEKKYPGVPTFDIEIVDPEKPFMACGIEIEPLPVMHYKLPILGYRIGPLAYITDCKTMPQSTLDKIRGVEVLVLNALRLEEHMSHLSLSEAVEIAKASEAKRVYFTHMSHQIGLAARLTLPSGMRLAHDFLTIEV